MAFQHRSFVLYTALLLAAPGALVAQPIGGEFQVNSSTTSEQAAAAAAADGDGDVVVVWSSFQDLFSANIFGQRYGSTGAAVPPSAGSPLAERLPMARATSTRTIPPALTASRKYCSRAVLSQGRPRSS